MLCFCSSNRHHFAVNLFPSFLWMITNRNRFFRLFLTSLDPKYSKIGWKLTIFLNCFCFVHFHKVGVTTGSFFFSSCAAHRLRLSWWTEHCATGPLEIFCRVVKFMAPFYNLCESLHALELETNIQMPESRWMTSNFMPLRV